MRMDENVGHAKRTAVFGLNFEDASRRSLKYKIDLSIIILQ